MSTHTSTRANTPSTTQLTTNSCARKNPKFSNRTVWLSDGPLLDADPRSPKEIPRSPVDPDPTRRGGRDTLTRANFSSLDIPPSYQGRIELR